MSSWSIICKFGILLVFSIFNGIWNGLVVCRNVCLLSNVHKIGDILEGWSNNCNIDKIIVMGHQNPMNDIHSIDILISIQQTKPFV